MRCCDQGAHNRERLTANRSDLTLQGRPNQHGTYLPHRTIQTNHSPKLCATHPRPVEQTWRNTDRSLRVRVLKSFVQQHPEQLILSKTYPTIGYT